MKLETSPEPDPEADHDPDRTPRLWVEAMPTFSAGGATSGRGPAAVHLMVSGDLDQETSCSMECAALAAIDSDPDVLVLDLSGVVFIDTSGLRAIVNTANTAERVGVRLVVGGMSGGVERLLELSGLMQDLSHSQPWLVNPN